VRKQRLDRRPDVDEQPLRERVVGAGRAHPVDLGEDDLPEEARDEIAASLLRPATRVTKGQWDKSHHLYACTYVYPNGQMTLSVKELSNGTQTTNYFNGLVAKYGKAQPLSIGQGGWLLKNGNVVVRKDYKVLLVDDTKIPPMFAQLMKRSDVGISVASVIMSCWTGA
jgi:hypothetical protein